MAEAKPSSHVPSGVPHHHGSLKGEGVQLVRRMRLRVAAAPFVVIASAAIFWVKALLVPDTETHFLNGVGFLASISCTAFFGLVCIYRAFHASVDDRRVGDSDVKGVLSGWGFLLGCTASMPIYHSLFIMLFPVVRGETGDVPPVARLFVTTAIIPGAYNMIFSAILPFSKRVAFIFFLESCAHLYVVTSLLHPAASWWALVCWTSFFYVLALLVSYKFGSSFHPHGFTSGMDSCRREDVSSRKPAPCYASPIRRSAPHVLSVKFHDRHLPAGAAERDATIVQVSRVLSRIHGIQARTVYCGPGCVQVVVDFDLAGPLSPLAPRPDLLRDIIHEAVTTAADAMPTQEPRWSPTTPHEAEPISVFFNGNMRISLTPDGTVDFDDDSRSDVGGDIDEEGAPGAAGSAGAAWWGGGHEGEIEASPRVLDASAGGVVKVMSKGYQEGNETVVAFRSVVHDHDVKTSVPELESRLVPIGGGRQASMLHVPKSASPDASVLCLRILRRGGGSLKDDGIPSRPGAGGSADVSAVVSALIPVLQLPGPAALELSALIEQWAEHDDGAAMRDSIVSDLAELLDGGFQAGIVAPHLLEFFRAAEAPHMVAVVERAAEATGLLSHVEPHDPAGLGSCLSSDWTPTEASTREDSEDSDGEREEEQGGLRRRHPPTFPTKPLSGPERSQENASSERSEGAGGARSGMLGFLSAPVEVLRNLTMRDGMRAVILMLVAWM